jgi:hypothetical protein
MNTEVPSMYRLSLEGDNQMEENLCGVEHSPAIHERCLEVHT